MLNFQPNFKKWVTSHDPECKWNFNDPNELREQLVNVIRESGHIDLKSLFALMFILSDSGLTVKQNERFIKKKY
jgi:hypothetical protein